MELKRVLGKDNRQAMEEVVRLYGPDALVVSSHKVNGKFELVIAVDIEADATLIDVPDSELAANTPAAPAAKVSDSSFRKILHSDDTQSRQENVSAHGSMRAQEIVELFREEIQVLKREIQETRKASAWHMQMANPEKLTSVQQALMDHPMPSRLRTLLIDSIAGIELDDEAEALLQAILTEGLSTATEAPEDISGVHAFFGPSGSGKTTLIGKLARMATDRVNPEKVAIISYADQKIGAWNQMQLMASQLGVLCYRANSPETLKTILREATDFECVLIDTSGVDISKHHAEISQYAPEALIHLVVATEVSRSSGERLFNEGLTWDSVNITKLDESNDAWILIDTLLQHTDTQLWLQSASDRMNHSLKLLNTAKWITSIIQTAIVRTEEIQDDLNTENDGRHESESVSTLEFLAGIRATRSGGSETTKRPAL